MLTLAVSLLVASPTGGVFSGPTHVNGSTIYWAPAVLGTVEEPTLVMAEVIGTLIHPSYQRWPEDASAEPAYDPVSFTTVTPDMCTTFLFDVPSRELRIYAGTFSPSGGGTRWPKDGAQRYQGTFGQIITYGAMAGLVWSPSKRLSFAAGGGPVYFNVKLQNSYDFGSFINSRLSPGADLFALEDPTLEGELKLAVDGWSVMGQLSAYARLSEHVELASMFFIAKSPELDGEAEVLGPAALRDALPNLVVNPKGRLVLPYALPWFINLEAQFTLGAWQIAPMIQFQRRSRQRLLVARLVESQSDFIEGDQLSLREVRDEVMMGLRVNRAVTPNLTLGARFDATPRNTPKEALTVVNIDFTLLELDVGFRYRLSDRTAIEATYGTIVAVPVEVERSIFNPRADPLSGLSASSPIGRYSAWGGKLTVALSVAFGS